MTEIKFQQITDYEHQQCSNFRALLNAQCIFRIGRIPTCEFNGIFYKFQLNSEVILLGKINSEISFVERLYK